MVYSSEGAITFQDHKEVTANDCDDVAKIITELAGKVREGNMTAFEQFWFEGGTEEGDAKINQIIEMLHLRYYHRKEEVA